MAVALVLVHGLPYNWTDHFSRIGFSAPAMRAGEKPNKQMKRTKRQALGQHFLNDPGILKKMIRQIDPRPEDTVIEIGAGRGALTFFLLARAGRVLAIEKDRSLVPLLKEGGHKNLVVIEDDVLNVSFESLVARGSQAKLVGNLPYSISSPILYGAARENIKWAGCWFLLQREVAERVCSSPGTKKSAPLSLLLQNIYVPKIQFAVPPSCFSPPPKVDSAFLSLLPRDRPLFCIRDQDRFLDFLRTCFRHRRKKLLNNLLASGYSRESLTEIFQSAGLEENIRAEQVTLSRFSALYELLFKG